jgi:hypothetical protein
MENAYHSLMTITVQLLSICPDFSMLKTLQDLQATAPVNPNFEITLKRNLCNNYCLQAALEPAKVIYENEARYAFSWLMSNEQNKETLAEQREALLQQFWETPLSAIKTDNNIPLSDLISSAIQAISNTEEILFP